MKLVHAGLALSTLILARAPAQAADPGSKLSNAPQAYGAGWNQEQSNSVLRDFHAWAHRLMSESNASARAAMLSDGIALARQRRAIFTALIQTNPEAALALTVPAAVRARLPAEIEEHLESRVSGIGDFSVVCVQPVSGATRQNAVERFVRINGTNYRAHVYGPRVWQTTQYGIPLHGVAVNENLALATSDNSGQAGNASAPASPPALSPTGLNRVLVIRVDFSDLPGDPRELGGMTYTAPVAQEILDSQVSSFYVQCSYGRTWLSNTVSPELFRMPRTAEYYATNGVGLQFHLDAQAVASTNYDLNRYDRLIVLFSSLEDIPGSSVNWAGMSEVDGKRVWIDGQFRADVVAHELGHSYGLWHANLWQVSDGDPISPAGQSSEYGDPFDRMGSGPLSEPRGDPNPWFKYLLGWIDDSQVLTVSSNGTYRVNRFDDPNAGGILALKIRQDSSRNYWIACRRNFTANSSLQNGAYIIWGYNQKQQSHLLDMSTPGVNTHDAAMSIGGVLVDAGANLVVQAIAQGGTTPTEYMDVQVTFGPAAPLLLAEPEDQMVFPGQSAVYQAKATGNPAPQYQWQKQAHGTATWADLSENEFYSGTKSANLILRGTAGNMCGDEFRCLATNLGGTVTTAPAALSVTPLGVTTLAGLTGWYRNPTDGIGRLARFNQPLGIAVENSGNLLVADTWNHTVRRVTSAGTVSTVAGVAGSSAYLDGNISYARFHGPAAAAMDATGNIFVADRDNHVIRKISPAGMVSTFAGTGGAMGSADGTTNHARFKWPAGLAVDAADSVYVADTGNHTIRKITPNGIVSTLAGMPEVSGSAEGSGNTARFNAPSGLAVDASGNLFVADAGNHTIRKVTDTGTVSTIAGMPQVSGSADGLAATAQFKSPTGVAVDAGGNVYVADTGNHTLRKITALGVVSTLAGRPGDAGSMDGAPDTARLNNPAGIAVDPAGHLYVADRQNSIIRKVFISEAPLATRIIVLGGQLAFAPTRVGDTSQGTLTILNRGSSSLNVAGVSFPQGFSGNWSGPIPAGASADVPVTFTPTAAIYYSGRIRVSSDATSGTREIFATGVGREFSVPPQLTGAAIGDGSFSFVLHGRVADTYSVQTSSNLVDWCPFSTSVIPFGGWLVLLDPCVNTEPRRFFRATLIDPRVPGRVLAWGDNQMGATNVPPDLTNVVAIAGGTFHSVALRSNGAISTWGGNSMGQRNVPSDLGGVSSVAVGFYHNLALTREGRVVGWGHNSYGQTNAPAEATNAIAVAAGAYHSLALTAEGRVLAWGAGKTNSGSQPHFGQSAVPPDLSNVVAVAAGEFHSLALRSDGSVTGWGDNSYGQLAFPPGLTNIMAIAAGREHNLALKNNHTVVAWGINYSGQRNVPAGLTNVIAIVAGGEHSLALKSDGRLVAWGRNTAMSGNLANQAVVPAGVSNIVGAAAGGYHSLLITTQPSP